MKNDEKKVDLESLIVELKKIVDDKRNSIYQKEDKLKLRVVKNKKRRKFFYKIASLLSLLLLLSLILSLGIGTSFIFVSYSLSTSLLTSAIEFLIAFTAVVGGACIMGSIYAIYKLIQNYYDVDKFLNKMIENLFINSIEKQINIDRNDLKNIPDYVKKVDCIEEKIPNINNYFNYILHNSTNNKSFSSKDVRTIYKLLEFHDFNTLVYLLKNNELDEFSKKDLKNRLYREKQIIEELRKDEKEYYANGKVRNRRTKRFHSEITDDSILQSNDNKEEVVRRKR